MTEPTPAIATRTTVVYTRRPQEVTAYLYEHTRPVASLQRAAAPSDVLGPTALLLVTTADTDARASYLAAYQAERLRSGLHGATVHTTYAEAWSHAASLTGPTHREENITTR